MIVTEEGDGANVSHRRERVQFSAWRGAAPSRTRPPSVTATSRADGVGPSYRFAGDVTEGTCIAALRARAPSDASRGEPAIGGTDGARRGDKTTQSGSDATDDDGEREKA